MTETISWPLQKWCRLTGVNRSTAYLHIKAGNLEVIRLGSRTYVTREASDRFLEKGRTGQATLKRKPGKSCNSNRAGKLTLHAS